MLTVNLNEDEGIALLEPDSALSEADFVAVSKEIDVYIEKTGKLNGLIVHVKSFPGWDSFSALMAHLKFVKEHHRKISHVALATDSPIGGFAEYVANYFVSAEIKRFAFNELDKAHQWILSDL